MTRLSKLRWSILTFYFLFSMPLLVIHFPFNMIYKAFLGIQEYVPLVFPIYSFYTPDPIRLIQNALTLGRYNPWFYSYTWTDFWWIYLVSFVIFCFIFKKILCAWICPAGFVQDALTKIRRFLKIKDVYISKNVHQALCYIKYVFLFLIIAVAWSIGVGMLNMEELNFGEEKYYERPACNFCPVVNTYAVIASVVHPEPYNLSSIISDEHKVNAVPQPTTFNELPLLGLFFIGGFLLISFFIPRAFCRYACPIAAMVAPFYKSRILTKTKDVQKCTKCGICARVCPMGNTNVYKDNKKNVDHPECIDCFRCVDACPEDDCLKVKFFGKTILRSKFKAK